MKNIVSIQNIFLQNTVKKIKKLHYIYIIYIVSIYIFVDTVFFLLTGILKIDKVLFTSSKKDYVTLD